MAEQIHTLKCHPAYFDATVRGDKLFDVRRDDRGFQKGDIVILQRTMPDRLFAVDTDYGGKPKREFKFRIGYILTGGQFGIEPGYVVLGHDPSYKPEQDNG